MDAEFGYRASQTEMFGARTPAILAKR